MKDYGTWWVTVPPKPMKWRKQTTDEDCQRGLERVLSLDEVKRTAAEWGVAVSDHEWAVERARHYIELREARSRFGLAVVLLICILIWAALIKGVILIWPALIKGVLWLLAPIAGIVAGGV